MMKPSLRLIIFKSVDVRYFSAHSAGIMAGISKAAKASKKPPAKKLAGGVDNPAHYYYTVCGGDFNKCEPQFVCREAGKDKRMCMISEKVKKGQPPAWVNYRAAK